MTVSHHITLSILAKVLRDSGVWPRSIGASIIVISTNLQRVRLDLFAMADHD